MAILRNKSKLVIIDKEGAGKSILGRNCHGTKKTGLSRESLILGALSKLAEFLPKSQVWTRSIPVPETSRNSNGENQKTNEDRSLNDPDPEIGVFRSLCSRKFDPEKTSYLVTGVHDKNPYCSSGTSSGKQRKGRFSVLRVNYITALKIPLPWLKLTTFFWPLNSWRATSTLLISLRTLGNFQAAEVTHNKNAHL